MTPAQKLWLDEHPNFSPVREYPAVSLNGWTDKGWLFHTGRFISDDGKTLFPHKFPSWFASKDPQPILVGRCYTIC